MSFFTLLFSYLLALSAGALTLSEYQPYEYDVRFTNPDCAEYKYAQPILTKDGQTLTAKPKGAFCTPADEERSQAQPQSPYTKLVEWIRDPETTEIFFAFLSFSNDSISQEVCNAIQTRNVKVRFVLDTTTSLKEANRLLACQPADGVSKPEFFARGGQNGLGFAHNKIFLINPQNTQKVRIAFGSGNLTTGISLHHENWHFITTSPQSHFAQAHQCVMRGMLEAGDSKKGFTSFMQKCRSAITTPQEDDIQSFFVPGEGNLASQALFKWVQEATHISIAAHRFSYTKLIDRLAAQLTAGAHIQLVLDDDVFWAGRGLITGANTKLEFGKAMQLAQKGADIRYVETNHWNKQFQHNKFLIFQTPTASAVFAGAGNLTGTAFSENFENFYVITIPYVVQSFQQQYAYLWGDLTTSPKMMPAENIKPVVR